MGHALALCQCEPIEKPIERRAEDAAQILSRKKERGWDWCDILEMSLGRQHTLWKVVRARGSKILH